LRVCVVGSGGRENALAIALGRTAEVVVTPGNPGISGRSEQGYLITSSPAPPEEIEADLFVIGPEAPLVDGLADRLRAKGRVVFGPGADGAKLEGSKRFMKDVLTEARVPTAHYGSFENPDEAIAFLGALPGPFVVKTDGLASGKGVLVTDSVEAARADIVAKLSGESFGEAGRRVVVEEGLLGLECSVQVLCDGKTLLPLVAARDYKRIGDGDVGPNTGGMGSISPVDAVDDALVSKIVDECVEPVVAVLRRRDIDYRGVLYAGLMMTAEGPKVLEYNVRFGDPETQVVVERTPGDLADLLYATATGELSSRYVTTDPSEAAGAAVCVVLAAEGYPTDVRTGDPIFGLDDVAGTPDLTIAYAGVGKQRGRLTTAGGRVLGITGRGTTLAEARDRAYAGCACVKWDGMQYRTDIGAPSAGNA
jgi:phosphoribosylamine---glycine ligase